MMNVSSKIRFRVSIGLTFFVLIVGYIILIKQYRVSNIGVYEAKNNGLTLNFTVYDQYEDYLTVQPEGLVTYNTKEEQQKLEENGYVFISGRVEVNTKYEKKETLKNWHLELITQKGKIISAMPVYRDFSIDETKYTLAFVADAMHDDIFNQAIVCINGNSYAPIYIDKMA